MFIFDRKVNNFYKFNLLITIFYDQQKLYINSKFKTVVECHYGTYGYNCVNNCSGHCRNDTPCNKQTGVCDKGCNPGYTGLDCKGSKLTISFVIC